jgi:hypothetical protein
VPPCGPVQRVDQLPGSAALAAAVVNINAAEAATIIAFIAVLLSFKGAVWRTPCDVDGSGVLQGFCRAACQYCNLLQARFAACAVQAP